MASDKPARKRIGFWQISTGTVLGALITAVFGSLLGSDAPWFVERLTAGSSEAIAFTVDSVFSGTRGALDPNKWHADPDVGFAVTKPPREWLINKTNPAAPLSGPSIGTVPFYRFSMDQVSPVGPGAAIQRDDIVTTEIRPSGPAHKLEFTDTSTIDAVALKFNPATSDPFLKRTLALQFRLQKALESELPSEALDILEQRTPEGRAMFAQLRPQLEAQFEKIVKTNWPAPLEYADNVTVTAFKTSLFRGDPIYEAVLQDRGLNLFTAAALVGAANLELMSVNTKSMSISANNLAMLLDTSIELRNFKLDGSPRDVAELRRFVLLVLHKDKVFVAIWRNLVGLGAPAEQADRMRDVFQSFRLLQGQ